MGIRPNSRKSTPQGLESRERLLDAGIALFSERGYAATSIDAVCRRAGTVRTALYWHFASKEGLLAAVVERVAVQWIEQIRKSAYLAGDPLARLERVIEGFREILEAKPHLLRLLLSVSLERSDVSPRTRRTLQGVFERAEAALVEGIEDALGREIPDLDLVAHTALALLQAALLRRLVDPDGADLERLLAELRRVILLSVASRLSEEERSQLSARAREGESP
jgi:AcrR family transcriptional regulator